MTLQFCLPWFSSWKLKLKVPGKTLDMYFDNDLLGTGLIYKGLSKMSATGKL